MGNSIHYPPASSLPIRRGDRLPLLSIFDYKGDMLELRRDNFIGLPGGLNIISQGVAPARHGIIIKSIG